MAPIAVLGIGLLGRGFAERALEVGQPVRVWNRTVSRCDGLAEQGAVVSASPADAARGASRVHLVLSEDHAVDAVIEALRPGLGDGVPVIDHSTNAPARTRARTLALAAYGVRYLHAPVFMGPRHSRTATGLMLTSGDPDLIASVREALASMTGTLWEVGDEPGRAAALKLVGNGLLVTMSAAAGDLFEVAAGAGLERADVLALFERFAPTPAAIARRVDEVGQGPVGFELQMARKDVRLMLEAAGDRPLQQLPAVAAAMDAALQAGHEAEDYVIFTRR